VAIHIHQGHLFLSLHPVTQNVLKSDTGDINANFCVGLLALENDCLRFEN